PPGNGMYVIFALLGTCAVLMAIGLLYRIAAIGFAVLFTWVFLIDQTWYLNHFYLITLLGWASTILPANRAWSVDAWLRPSLRSSTVPAWSLWLLRFLIALPYFYGGIAKLNPDWVTGVPMRLMMGDGANYPILGPYFGNDSVIVGFAIGGMLFDLLIVPALMWGPTRIPAYLAAIAFHASNARMFKIGIFPLVMVAASMLFFPPEWLKPEVKEGEVPPAAPPGPTGPLTLRQKATVALLGIFVTWQLLMPFRHWLYPGDVSWTEEGHRFSWHMKLRTKTASAVFRATDKDGNPLDTFTKPQDILHRRQLELIGERPDFVLQYGKWIGEELRQQGHEGVHVYATVMATLNGRKPQLLIDPEVDLVTTPRTLRHNDWIVPLTEPLPTLAELRARHTQTGQLKPPVDAATDTDPLMQQEE
ncbi:MAG: HTTM domain-containing protein, partial [Planctomycetaceae bacterium]|nr:HTTM domain-containing protein [Planctomycetaceae bacterium]